MDKVMELKPGAKDADLQAAIKEMLAEMGRIDIRIAQNQSDINRLQAETRVMLSELKTSLGMFGNVATIL